MPRPETCSSAPAGRRHNAGMEPTASAGTEAAHVHTMAALSNGCEWMVLIGDGRLLEVSLQDRASLCVVVIRTLSLSSTLSIIQQTNANHTFVTIIYELFTVS
jgi:hypothetical protein